MAANADDAPTSSRAHLDEVNDPEMHDALLASDSNSNLSSLIPDGTPLATALFAAQLGIFPSFTQIRLPQKLTGKVPSMGTLLKSLKIQTKLATLITRTIPFSLLAFYEDILAAYLYDNAGKNELMSYSVMNPLVLVLSHTKTPQLQY